MCSETLNLQLRTKFEIDALFQPVLIHGMAEHIPNWTGDHTCAL